MTGPRAKRIAFTGSTAEEKKDASPSTLARKSLPADATGRKRRLSPMRNLPTRAKSTEAPKLATGGKGTSTDAFESLTKAAESLAEVDAKAEAKPAGVKDPAGKKLFPTAPATDKAAARKPDPPTGATPLSAKKKRPYRRTKRPKNYNDKSTITTTTPAAETPVNAFDLVLGEAEDLLNAATDAQILGRLKMASTYQLLLHTRLVGLAKRFDRAQVVGEEEEEAKNTHEETSSGMQPTRLDMNAEMSSPERKPKVATPQKIKSPAPSTPKRKTMQVSASSPAAESLRTPQRKNRGENTSVYDRDHAVNQLANYLPANIELDVKMMEHLARAAAELHHQRTGRKIASDGLLASPAINTQGVLHYNKEICATGNDESDGDHKSPAKRSPVKRSAMPVTWTDEEKKQFGYATVQMKLSDPVEIAEIIPSKNEAEVKAYLIADRNKGAVAKETTAVMSQQDSSPKKKGGRGRKPPTTAINTVPNANLDVRSLLQGKGLSE